MKPADEDLQPASPETPGEIRSTRKLIGLNSYKSNKGTTHGGTIRADDSICRNPLNRIIKDGYFDLEVFTQEPPTLQVLGQTVEASESVAWKHAAKVANNIPFLVVLGGLDQYNSHPLLDASSLKVVSDHSTSCSGNSLHANPQPSSG
jgi:hypothetical protein